MIEDFDAHPAPCVGPQDSTRCPTPAARGKEFGLCEEQKCWHVAGRISGFRGRREHDRRAIFSPALALIVHANQMSALPRQLILGALHDEATSFQNGLE